MSRPFAIIMWLCTFTLSSLPATVIGSQKAPNLGLTRTEIDTVTEAANNKARELGYNPKALQFTLSKEGEFYVADFSPKQQYEKGVITYGGGLTIWIDKRGKILRYQKQI